MQVPSSVQMTKKVIKSLLKKYSASVSDIQQLTWILLATQDYVFACVYM